MTQKLDAFIPIHLRWIIDGSLAKSVISVKNILVATQKDKAIELRDKLDNFMKIFD